MTCVVAAPEARSSESLVWEAHLYVEDLLCQQASFCSEARCPGQSSAVLGGSHVNAHLSLAPGVEFLTYASERPGAFTPEKAGQTLGPAPGLVAERAILGLLWDRRPGGGPSYLQPHLPRHGRLRARLPTPSGPAPESALFPRTAGWIRFSGYHFGRWQQCEPW